MSGENETTQSERMQQLLVDIIFKVHEQSERIEALEEAVADLLEMNIASTGIDVGNVIQYERNISNLNIMTGEANLNPGSGQADLPQKTPSPEKILIIESFL